MDGKAWVIKISVEDLILSSFIAWLILFYFLNQSFKIILQDKLKMMEYDARK